MKFGLRFHEFRTPRWDAHYIDYNGICQRIRDSKPQTGACSLTEVRRYMEENIASLEDFRSHLLESISRRETRLSYQFGLPSTSATLSNVETVDRLELQILRTAYENLMQDLKELRWFDKVNATAMWKLFAKLPNSGDDSALAGCQAQWYALEQNLERSSAELFERIDKIATEICREASQARLGKHSWYFTRLMSRHHDADLHSELYCFVKHDQHTHVEKQILSREAQGADLKGSSVTFVASIFLASILFSAKNTAALALEFMLRKEVKAEIVFGLVHIHHVISQTQLDESETSKIEGIDYRVKHFAILLDASMSKAMGTLTDKDEHGWHLLHYASHYGLQDFCEVILSRLLDRDEAVVAAMLTSRDSGGRTPLHHAVEATNEALLSLLLNTLHVANINSEERKEIRAVLVDLLILAIRAKSDEMAKMLLAHAPDLGQRSNRGETALYCAAQLANPALVSLLLRHLTGDERALNLPEQSRGWTPLIVACAQGHKRTAELLLRAGSDPAIRDARGWTALEHAVFRGHHDIAVLFSSQGGGHNHDWPAEGVRAAHMAPKAEFIVGEKLLVLHFGSTQGGHSRPAVQLGQFKSTTTTRYFQQNRLELHISIIGTETPTKIIQLPVLDDQLHRPLMFTVREGLPLQVLVEVYRREHAKPNLLVCSGTTLLDQEQILGQLHESLIRERTIYLMRQEDHDLTGSVLLSYVVANPFLGLETLSRPFASDQGSVLLVGHRGLGQNVSSRSFLQLGENTVTSMLSAAKFGASFVEFDLQVTRDLQAVVYHDFSLSESGTDVPIHDLTLEQYKHASDINEPQASASYHTAEIPFGAQRRPRAWSSGEESMSKAAQLRRKMRYTVDVQNKSFKPNSRGHVIQDSLATLEDLLLKLPQDIGFNIEIKYPRLHEAAEAGVAPVAVNINAFIDVALEKLAKFAGNRKIILSSFTPEVCILLAVKQAAYPVMFITNAGKPPVQDQELRGASLQAAMRFARLWNLSGIVLACETFLYCPRLVQFVKSRGLICASYGLLNNEPNNARIQVAAGVDILMVDRVKLIADSLNEARTGAK